jgi:membrane-associated phospholipid phosphatase
MRLGAVTVSLLLVLLSSPLPASAQTRAVSIAGSRVADDFKYLIDNVQLDVEDVATAPLHIASPDSVLSSPKFYLGLAGAGVLLGGSFALDQTLRSHLHDMSSSDANLLQSVSYASVGASTALLYGYGLYDDDARARQYALTAGEGAGVAALLAEGIKVAFGRLRPREDHNSHSKFFDGGKSFVSGEVAPIFAFAAGVSEYFDNEWYVAVPVYSLALADGFGRMGHDAHWFSDVVGAALLGWGTTELFLYLHARHAEEPSRWRIIPMGPQAALPGDGSVASAGCSVAYFW